MKHIKLFEEFLNEDMISISKEEMENLHNDGEIEVGDHTITFEENTVNEAKSVGRDEMIAWIEKTMNVAGTSEEFNGSQGGIWLCGECGDKYKGQTIYDYYSENYSKYDLGVLTKWEKELNKRGWYSDWYDAGTVMVRPD